jgi:hypothetical protein
VTIDDIIDDIVDDFVDNNSPMNKNNYKTFNRTPDKELIQNNRWIKSDKNYVSKNKSEVPL